MATKSTATKSTAARKPRVSRKPAAPVEVKPTVTIVHGTRGDAEKARVTRVSRVNVEREHGVKLPKGVSAGRATDILLATGKFAGVEKLTWSKAPAELRAILAAIGDEDGDEGDE